MKTERKRSKKRGQKKERVVISTLIGGISGFLGRKVDLAMQCFVDAWMAFPGLLLLLTIMSIVGQGLLQIIVVLGVAGGIGGSRIMRGVVIGIKENDYFLAARAVGTSTSQILIRHVLPNIMAPIIIVFSINIGRVIMAELPGIRSARRVSQLGRDAQDLRVDLN